MRLPTIGQSGQEKNLKMRKLCGFNSLVKSFLVSAGLFGAMNSRLAQVYQCPSSPSEMPCSTTPPVDTSLPVGGGAAGWVRS